MRVPFHCLKNVDLIRRHASLNIHHFSHFFSLPQGGAQSPSTNCSASLALIASCVGDCQVKYMRHDSTLQQVVSALLASPEQHEHKGTQQVQDVASQRTVQQKNEDLVEVSHHLSYCSLQLQQLLPLQDQ